MAAAKVLRVNYRVCDECKGFGRIVWTLFGVSIGYTKCKACYGKGSLMIHNNAITGGNSKGGQNPNNTSDARPEPPSGSDRCNEAFKALGAALVDWERNLIARKSFIDATGSGTVYVGVGLEDVR